MTFDPVLMKCSQFLYSTMKIMLTKSSCSYFMFCLLDANLLLARCCARKNLEKGRGAHPIHSTSVGAFLVKKGATNIGLWQTLI